jgi:hypothetical protein
MVAVPPRLQDNLRGYLLPPTKGGTPAWLQEALRGNDVLDASRQVAQNTTAWQKCFRRYARGAVQTAAGWF